VTGPSTAPSARWVAGAAVLGVLSAAWLVVRVVQVTWHQPQSDLAVYLLGARHLVDGHLYSVMLPTVPHLPFTYPPLAALGFVPLAWLPHSAAQLVWAGVNVASLYAVLALSLRAALPDAHRTRVLLGALVLLSPSYLLDPVRLTFYFGQVNLVLCALLLADLTRTLRVGRWTLPRGVLVGATAAVKLVPLVFVPYLFATRQVRAAWTAVVSFGVLSLVAAAVDPSASWDYWTHYATDASRVGDPAFHLNQSLLGVVDRAAHRLVSPTLVDVAAVLLLVAGIALARWAWRDSSVFLGVLVCAATGMLVSPITWQHHAVWCVPVLVWLALGPDRPPAGPAWALAAGVLLWWSPLERGPLGVGPELHERGWTLVAGDSTFLLAVAFLVGVAVLLAVRRARTGVSGPPSPAPSTAATT